MKNVQMIPLAAFAGATLLAVGQSASAGPLVIWDQFPYVPDSALASQLDVAFPFEVQTADDFQLSSTHLVTDVHWAGGFFNLNDAEPPFDIPSFNILFYNDAGGTPTGGPGDPTATAIMTYNLVADSIDNGDGSFSYWVDLPTPFEATGGVTYWLAIQAVFEFPPQWGWSQSANPIQLNEAQFGFPFIDVDYWSPISETFETDPADMAFQLTGVPVPAPGTIALFGMAGLVARRRRRQAGPRLRHWSPGEVGGVQ